MARGRSIRLQRTVRAGLPRAQVREFALGRLCRRDEVAPAAAYAVFDCETTGLGPEAEIVSFALLRLDGDGNELERLVARVRPHLPIEPDAQATHGIGDAELAGCPPFAAFAAEISRLLDGAVFTAHNADFDLRFLQAELERSGVVYRPTQVACTLRTVQLLEPEAAGHRLAEVCARRQIVLEGAHDAGEDAEATAELLRDLLHGDGVAPETAVLDTGSWFRMRAIGDERPATPKQLGYLFFQAREAGFGRAGGRVDKPRFERFCARVLGEELDGQISREQLQLVLEALDARIARLRTRASSG